MYGSVKYQPLDATVSLGYYGHIRRGHYHHIRPEHYGHILKALKGGAAEPRVKPWDQAQQPERSPEGRRRTVPRLSPEIPLNIRYLILAREIQLLFLAGASTLMRGNFTSGSALCMIQVATPLGIKKKPVVVAFSLLLSLCECLWKCEKSWDVDRKHPQKNTGGRKRTPFELRARPEGRSSARTPSSSRTGPCPRRTYRRKGERLGCGITHGGLP
jgi:hypothetical protein